MTSPIVLNPASIASVVVIGDSNSEGTGATLVERRWQQVLQAMLRARIQPAGVAGAEVPYLSAWPRVSPMFAGYGRTATPGVTQVSFGLGLRAASVPAGEQLTFTFFGTRAKLLGTKGPAVGRYGVRLDGGAETVVEGANGSSISGQVIWDSGTLPAELHTVSVVRASSTTVSPGAVIPEGLMVYNGDTGSGVRVVDGARHAAILASFNFSTAWHTAFTAIENKQLLIMPWGANDAVSGTTAAAFRSGVEQLIGTVRSLGYAGPVMLPKMPKRGGADPVVWADYLAQLDAIASADPTVVTVDIRSRIPDQGTPEAVARGLYVDEVHFSDAGQKLIAQILAEAILGDVWSAQADVQQVRVEAAFGANLTANPASWVWTDLSSRLQPEPVRIRAGRSSGAQHASPSSCTVALLNDDGALTPRNPMSPYWPNVQRGTPLRVSVLRGGVWRERFSGFADEWAPIFMPTTTPGEAHSVARVTASGLLRRLEQGAFPAKSAPVRYIPTTNPVAYWPLEDGELVSEGAALVGGQPMRPFVGTHPSGAVITFTAWGRGDLAPWLPQALSRTGNHGLAIVWAPVSMPSTSRWVIDFMYRSGTDAGDSAVDVNPAYLGGALGWPQLALLPEFRGVDVAMNGEPEVQGTADTLFDGKPHHVRWDVYQNGAKVSWNVYVDAVMVNFGTTTGNMTLPSVQSIGLTAGAQSGADMAQGHVAVWTSPPPVEQAVAAALGHAGEPAATRIARLCAEEGVPITVAAGDSELMGPQPVAGLVELLREAEAADMGVLYEQGFGLGYRPRWGRYSPPVAMSVDLSTHRVARGGGESVLVPLYDDQDLRNEWTVGRIGGQAPVTVLDAAHQAKSGVYSDSAELNINSDSRLLDHASWRVHLGTVDELREATFPLDLVANPELVNGWLGCRVGSRIKRTYPPVQYGPGPLDTLIDGWTETIGPQSWMVQVTPAPAAPWEVGVVDGDQRIASSGSSLAADLSASGTSMLLSSSPADGLWTQDPTDFPLEIRVGGERVIASAIAAPPRLNSNALFEGTIAPWTSPDNTPLSVSTAQAHQGSSSMLISPTGTTSMARAETEFMTITGGRRYRGFFWARCSVARTIDLYIAWYTSGGTFIDAGIRSIPVAANTWVVFDATYTAPANAGRAKLGVRLTGTPPTTHTTWVDEAFFVDADHQTVTLSARGVNGVRRAWPAGTPVDVWTPAYVAL